MERSWHEVGEDVGLEVIDEEEVEEEEEDLEVKKIFKDSKAKHRQIMKGMHTNNVLNHTHVEEVEDVQYKCNSSNSIHVRDVEDTCT